MPEQTPTPQQQPEHKKLPIFTTSKNCHTTILLDGSVFEPTKKTILTPGNFAKNYAKQLRELLYNTEDKISVDALLYISQLYDVYEQTNHPFRFVSGIHVRRLPIITEQVSLFFSANKALIASITQQFK